MSDELQTMNSDNMESAVEEPEGKPRLHVWFDRCMLFLFLATSVWALVATFRFHGPPFDGCSILFLALIAGLIGRKSRILAIPVVFLLLMVMTVPMRSGARDAARSSQCRNNLKLIMIALHNYHDDYGCFPPAYVADENGQPMHGWRVLILPYLEQNAVYEQYRFDEPWNGPNNSQLAGEICSVFHCFSEFKEPSTTNPNYVLITGDGTAWADGRAPKLDDFTDGAANTLILAEIVNSDIHWMEPRDLTLDQAMRGINSQSGMCISSWHKAHGSPAPQKSANVAFADGSTVNLENDFPLDELEKLLTYQGGEKVNRPESER